jgi:putative hemolysin
LHLREVRVRECMVPRNEIKGIDINSSIEELIEMFKESKHSRVLIYEDDIDNILGYTHHQQLLYTPKSTKKICIPLPYVPETMHVRQLMNEFIKNNNSIACVVDEFGGTSGIITLEDILEEIFGEIEDEHDTPDYINEKLDKKSYRFSGRLELDQITETHPELSFTEGEYHTLSGYLVMTTENIPESNGEEIFLDNYHFIIEAVTNTKIETVKLIVLEEKEEENNSEAKD